MPIYMKYGSISGTVAAKGFEKWIELQSAQFGSRGNLTPEPRDATVTKDIDISSNDLFREALFGEPAKVRIAFVPAKSDTAYLVITMSKTLISSYSTSGNHGTPMESLSLNYEKIEYGTQTASTPNPGKPAPHRMRP